jgi:DNA/RNA-binding domain of Phe-tRNA-synthetase-like protein
MAVWVDDEGHCHVLHPAKEARHHAFRDEKGRVWAIVCPMSLTDEERMNVRQA